MWNYILERDYLFVPILIVNTIVAMILGMILAFSLIRWVLAPIADWILK